MTKIKITTPKISLIDNIGPPPNSSGNYTQTVSDLGVNIHIENEAVPTMDPVIISNNMTARLPDVSTVE